MLLQDQAEDEDGQKDEIEELFWKQLIDDSSSQVIFEMMDDVTRNGFGADSRIGYLREVILVSRCAWSVFSQQYLRWFVILFRRLYSQELVVRWSCEWMKANFLQTWRFYTYHDLQMLPKILADLDEDNPGINPGRQHDWTFMKQSEVTAVLELFKLQAAGFNTTLNRICDYLQHNDRTIMTRLLDQKTQEQRLMGLVAANEPYLEYGEIRDPETGKPTTLSEIIRQRAVTLHDLAVLDLKEAYRNQSISFRPEDHRDTVDGQVQEKILDHKDYEAMTALRHANRYISGW